VFWHHTVPAFADLPVGGASIAHELVPVRAALRRVARDTVGHPFGVARAAIGGEPPRSVAALLAWRPTAACLGCEEVQTVDGTWSALTRLLPRPLRPTRRAQATIGLAMIAQDEQATIASALLSAAPWVDQMVVVDGGSTDDTIAEARGAGATVIEAAWPGDFSAQRNRGLDSLKTEWALVIDADEELGEGLGPLMRAVASRTNAGAVSMARLNQYVERGPEPVFWPSYTVRLFRAALRYSGRVHENVPPVPALTLPLSGPYVIHRKTLRRQLRGYRRYADLEDAPWTEQVIEELEREIADDEGKGASIDE
jgi:hypothetical protein